MDGRGGGKHTDNRGWVEGSGGKYLDNEGGLEGLEASRQTTEGGQDAPAASTRTTVGGCVEGSGGGIRRTEKYMKETTEKSTHSRRVLKQKEKSCD